MEQLDRLSEAYSITLVSRLGHVHIVLSSADGVAEDFTLAGSPSEVVNEAVKRIAAKAESEIKELRERIKSLEAMVSQAIK